MAALAVIAIGVLWFTTRLAPTVKDAARAGRAGGRSLRELVRTPAIVVPMVVGRRRAMR